MSKIKVGQVWQQENDEIFVVTFIEKYDNDAFLLYTDGYTSSTYISKDYNPPFIFNKLLAEYPTWQEAINSKEFNNG